MYGEQGVGKTTMVDKLLNRQGAQERKVTKYVTYNCYKPVIMNTNDIYIIDTPGCTNVRYDICSEEIIDKGDIGIYLIKFDTIPFHVSYIINDIKIKRYKKILICLNKIADVDFDLSTLRDCIEKWKHYFITYGIDVTTDISATNGNKYTILFNYFLHLLGNRYTLVATEFHGGSRIKNDETIATTIDNGAFSLKGLRQWIDEAIGEISPEMIFR
jgi:small GTP-binding protein